MARYMRTDLGKGHARLSPPTVVGAGIAWHGPGVYFTSPLSTDDVNLRRRVQSDLRLTRIVGAPVVTEVARPIKVWLVPKRAVYELTRRSVTYIPPEPIIPPLPPPIRRVVPRRTDLLPRRTRTILEPPAVIGAGIVFRPLRVELAYSRRGQAKSRLRPPVVVGAAAVAAVFVGPEVHLAPARRPSVLSFLRKPTVIGPASVAYGPGRYLVAPRSTYVRRRLGRSFLRPPSVVVVIAVQVFYGPQTTLAYHLRGRAKSRLYPPAAVGAGIVFRPVDVELAYSRRGVPKSQLGRPIIPPLAKPIRVSLARITPPKTHPKLVPPAVVGAGIVYRALQVHLAYSSRGRAKSRLRPPSVVQGAPLARPTEVTLARIRPAQTRPKLFPPAVIGAGIVYRALQVELAYSRRGAPKSRLSPPVIPALAAPIRVALARITPPRTHFVLRAPAVVGAGIVYRPLQARLAYSLRGQPKSRLFPPAVVGVVEVLYFGPQVSLAPQVRRPGKARLKPPVVIGRGIAWHGPGVYLTLPRRPIAKSRLSPPQVVIPVPLISYGPQVTLAPSHGGRPLSKLRAPVSVLRPFARPTLVWLAESRRGAPRSFLRKPVIPPLAREIQVSLAYSLRGRPLSKLKPPQVVRHAVEILGPEVTLAPSRRVRTRFFLRKPVVVFAFVVVVFTGPSVTLAYSRRGLAKPFRQRHVIGIAPFRPTSVTLAYSRRGQAKPFRQRYVFAKALEPLRITLAYSRRGQAKSFRQRYIVGKEPFRPLQVTLAPSRRIPPKSFLRRLQAPVVVSQPPFRPLLVSLAPSLRGAPKSVLSPPTIVGAAVAFYGPLVSLARIIPPATRYLVTPPVIVVHVCYGIVLGGDENRFPEVMTDMADQAVGGDSGGGNVVGTSEAGSKVSGGDSSGGSETLRDDRREGC